MGSGFVCGPAVISNHKIRQVLPKWYSLTSECATTFVTFAYCLFFCLFVYYLRSLGCTVVEMLTGKPPLGHLEPAAAIFRIGSRPIKPALPENVSLSAKEFVKAALTWLVLFRK